MWISNWLENYWIMLFEKCASSIIREICVHISPFYLLFSPTSWIISISIRVNNNRAKKHVCVCAWLVSSTCACYLEPRMNVIWWQKFKYDSQINVLLCFYHIDAFFFFYFFIMAFYHTFLFLFSCSLELWTISKWQREKNLSKSHLKLTGR